MNNDLTGNLQFLINCLKHEMPEYADYPVPTEFNTAFNLYRALCNVRMPQGETGHTLSEDFYRVQAITLKAITQAKHINDIQKLSPSKKDSRLLVWQGDITTLKVDAIVNAANNQMLGCFSPLHGCIDNIIHTMAGVELREECHQIMKSQHHLEPTGHAKITSGYNLPAKYVLHTVGPIVQENLTSRHRQLLAACYNSCLDLAARNNIRSIAFCCISTGVFMFPQDQAAKIAVETVQNWLNKHTDTSVKQVVFNVFKDNDLKIYNRLLNA